MCCRSPSFCSMPRCAAASLDIAYAYRSPCVALRCAALVYVADRASCSASQHVAHQPYEVPASYNNSFSFIPDDQRRTYHAMVTCLDDVLKEIIASLKTEGLWDVRKTEEEISSTLLCTLLCHLLSALRSLLCTTYEIILSALHSTTPLVLPTYCTYLLYLSANRSIVIIN